jgi:hypothetical protein
LGRKQFEFLVLNGLNHTWTYVLINLILFSQAL